MDIAVPIFDGITALDAVGPYEVLSRLPGARVRFLAREPAQGKVITAAGVSAGIDMALVLAARVAGPEVAQAIQLGIEYDPQPPFDAGSTAKAPVSVVELVRSVASRYA